MKPAMYIFLNKGLHMSPGKIAAQAGHAAVEALRLSQVHPPHIPSDAYWMDTEIVKEWYKGGHYAKYVCEARDNEHLRDIERYLNDRGFRTALILDEGHTEVPPISPTALGVALVDKDDPHTAATFSSFKLYREPPWHEAYQQGVKDGEMAARKEPPHVRLVMNAEKTARLHGAEPFPDRPARFVGRNPDGVNPDGARWWRLRRSPHRTTHRSDEIY